MGSFRPQMEIVGKLIVFPTPSIKGKFLKGYVFAILVIIGSALILLICGLEHAMTIFKTCTGKGELERQLQRKTAAQKLVGKK